MLSVVVVFFGMRREAARTLRSLSRSYQEGVEGLDYEVIAVENGSAPDQVLGGEFVGEFGPEFRYLDLGEDAAPSPAHAMNRGIALARGEALALMIDGAHVLTPGVLRRGLDALSLHDPAVVATQRWYVGPGLQYEVAAAGYDQAYEDRLFERIGWPRDGYRLFEIGHFMGQDRDWFDPLNETNCLFASRALVESEGGFDERFDVAGGGLVNLDLFERLVSAPGVTPATVLGEASFHQLHGGTMSNAADPEVRAAQLEGYKAHYEVVRGKPFRRPGKPMQFVGHMPAAAMRTRLRRHPSKAFRKLGLAYEDDGPPPAPAPVPDDLEQEFTAALWHSLAWRETTWLGHPTDKTPADLLAYQQLLVRLRPEWIVETRTGGPPLAPFLASVCTMIGRGRVLTIGAAGVSPDDRAVTIPGDPADPATLAAAHEILGSSSDALVLLGTRRAAPEMLAEFEGLAGFVPVDGYVVVEDTIVGGHPVWPGFGPGPMRVARTIVRDHDFVADRALERFGASFNRRGYLRRTG